MFADDTKMVSAINPPSVQEDTTSLQTDIDTAFTWTDTWLMELNAAKCKVMHLGNHNPNHLYTTPTREVQPRKILETTTQERDLGIILSNNHKPTMQCNKAAIKASSIYGMMKKSIHSSQLPIWKIIYTTYIHPHLEYAIQSWNPYLKEDIAILESVQKRVTNKS